jgi:hypothetical protein
MANAAITNNPMQQMKTKPSDTETHRGKRMFWGLSVDTWNNLIVGFGVLSGAFVLLTGAATYIAFQLQKAEAADAADSFNRYKLATEKQISDANESAEKARLEQERLKQLVSWRTLDAANVSALVAELSKGSGEVDIGFIPSDPESKYFALKVLGDAFIAANNSGTVPKWHVYLRAWQSDGMIFGIAIPGPENDQVELMRRAFSAAHIEFSSGDLPEETPPIPIGAGLKYTPAPKHDVFILIGLRSPPL